jgi:hypothetical protein
MRVSPSQVVLFLAFFWAVAAGAVVNSPTSVEVRFSYVAEFVTSKTSAAEELIPLHARTLIGYMQSTSQAKKFGLQDGIEGIGTPSWPLQTTVIFDGPWATKRKIRYRSEGRLLLNKKVARRLLKTRRWKISLPYNLDHFFDRRCAGEEDNNIADFWYSYDPFLKGCKHLIRRPMAKTVIVDLKTLPTEPELSARLGELRGDNGNGQLFQIATIDGFDSDAVEKNDDGRVSFKLTNEWLRKQGFKEKVVKKANDYEIHSLDKTVTRKDGRRVHIQMLRLLGETDLKEKNSDIYAKFFVKAIRQSDVIVYEGHSGFGMNLNAKNLQDRAREPVVFNKSKRQVFFFDSCSSYSYFMQMFSTAKNPGTLDILSNGLQSIVGFGVPVTEALYSYLLDVDNDDVTWNEILTAMEKPLNGLTFMLNVNSN